MSWRVATVGLLVLGSVAVVAPTPASAAFGLATEPTMLSPASTDFVIADSGDPGRIFYDHRTTIGLFSAPVVGDVTGDGVADVVAGYPNGDVQIWDESGTHERTIFTGPGAVQGTVRLVDLNGDGVVDIVGANTAGKVFAYTGGGTPLLDIQLPAREGLAGVFASPAVGDLGGDGVLDLVVSSWNQYLYVWSLPRDGSGAIAPTTRPGFPFFMKDTSWSSPVLADVDGNGHVDIAIAYDCTGVEGQDCAGSGGGGYLNVLDDRGLPLPGWPVFLPGQVPWSTPAIGDLDGDGHQDLVIGTGYFWPAPRGQFVFAFDRHGQALPHWPVLTQGRTFSSPAIGDVDHDGHPDVAFLDEHTRLYAVHASGQPVAGFPQCSDDDGRCDTFSHTSPTFADVTGDGAPDLLSVGQTTLNVWGPDGQRVGSIRTAGQAGTLTAPPVVADLEGEVTVLAAATQPSTRAGAYVGAVQRWGTGVAGAPPRPKAVARDTGDACPPGQVPEDGFGDVPATNVHEAAVDCLVWWGVTDGRAPGVYEPGGLVTRGQMATFLAHVITQSGGTLPDSATDAFSDDDGSVHEANINRLAATGIVTGRADGTYGASAPVSRAAMATFLARTAAYRTGAPLPDGGDYFSDDDGSVHEANINATAAAGLTGGTGTGTLYRPNNPVHRDQMASFLTRLLDLLVETDPGIPVPPS